MSPQLISENTSTPLEGVAWTVREGVLISLPWRHSTVGVHVTFYFYFAPHFRSPHDSSKNGNLRKLYAYLNPTKTTTVPQVENEQHRKKIERHPNNIGL